MIDFLGGRQRANLDDLRAALRRLDGGVVAVDGRQAPQVLPVITDLARGNEVSDSRIKTLDRKSQHAIGGGSRPTIVPGPSGTSKNIAIVTLAGVALYDLEYQPYCFSTRLLAKNIAVLAADPSVGTIVLDINTPGGQVTGTQEAADAVFVARSRKPVIGIVNPLCASAGYWIASQCTSIVAVPSADVGSIGVFMTHYDYSGMLSEAGIKPTFISAGPHKVEGNSMQPLGADAKAFYQSQVDRTYVDFTSAVARGRGVSVASVKTQMGGGRCLDARDALSAKMIDVIQSPDAAIQRIVAGVLPARQAVAPSLDYRTRLVELAAKTATPAERTRQAEVDRQRRRLAVLSA